MSNFRERVDAWSREIGRPLTAFEQAKVARPFRYDTGTRRWYRVLKPVLPGSIVGFVEMDLSCHEDDPIKYPLLVTVHTQRSNKSDKFLSTLPDEETQAMTNKVGPAFTKWALFADIWPGIDDVRLHYLAKKSNVSIPLHQVMKPEAWFD